MAKKDDFDSLQIKVMTEKFNRERKDALNVCGKYENKI